jgi:hypothetical protein
MGAAEMTNTKNDGGPAFPQLEPNSAYFNATGMTLRDWFAGQALAGGLDRWLEVQACDKEISGWAYEIADAMLEARK